MKERFLYPNPLGVFEVNLNLLPDFPSEVGVLSCLDDKIKQEVKRLLPVSADVPLVYKAPLSVLAHSPE